jgi:pyruvate kinase
VHVAELPNVTEIADDACEIAVREGLARPGDTVAIAGGMPFGVAGMTNLLRIAQVPVVANSKAKEKKL